MCGIAGVLDLRHKEAVSPRLLKNMAGRPGPPGT